MRQHHHNLNTSPISREAQCLFEENRNISCQSPKANHAMNSTVSALNPFSLSVWRLCYSPVTLCSGKCYGYDRKNRPYLPRLLRCYGCATRATLNSANSIAFVLRLSLLQERRLKAAIGGQKPPIPDKKTTPN